MVMKNENIIPEVFIGNERKDNILSIEDMCMACAKAVSMRSKDPSTQVGACIVGQDNRILSLGYNGAPNGWNDSEFPWGKDHAEIAKKYEKYSYVIHAEMNAIINYKGYLMGLEGSTIYVTLFPCSNCAKLIVQSGIKKVIYDSDKYKDSEDTKAAKILFDNCGVECVQYNSELSKMEIPLENEKPIKMVRKSEVPLKNEETMKLTRKLKK